MSYGDTLAPLEAALLLGITPELLFAYTRYSPKKAMAVEQKLATVEVNGRTSFRREDLEAFDRFLKEPWADSGQERPAIPTYVADYLKVECGSQCARCGAGFPLKNAHLDEYAASRSHHHHNLLRLCAPCHDAFDAGIVPRDEIVRIKQALVSAVRRRVEDKLSYLVPRSRALPVPMQDFVGRDAELLALEEALSSQRLVSVYGPGGSGKTELVIQTLSRCADPREVIWIELDSGINPRALELALCGALPISTGGRIEQMAGELDALARYIVFDGVEQAEDGSGIGFEEAVAGLVASTQRVRFVFTSQVTFLDLPIEHAIQLEGLGAEPSRAILCTGWSAHVQDSERDALASLERFADGHPLTLRIANALLRFYGSANVVFQRVAQYGAAAISHPARKPPKRLTSLQQCLGIAYLALSDDAKRLMFLASHCPAGFVGPMVELEDYEIGDVQTAIAIARRWHLLEEVGVYAENVPRLRALAPIRAFMRDAFAEQHATQAASLLLVLIRDIAVQAAVIDDKYFHGTDLATGMARVDAELPNMLHALEQARVRTAVNVEYFDYVRTIASSLQVFCFIAGSATLAVDVMRMGVEAAIRTERWSAAAQSAIHLLVHALRVGDSSVEVDAIAALRELSERTAQSDVAAPHAMAESMLALEQRRPRDALTWAEKAIALSRDSSPEEKDCGQDKEDERTLAMALMTSGRALEALGQHAAALPAYEEALTLMYRFGDEVNPGAVLHQMGNCNAYMRNPETSAKCYTEAARRFASVGFSEHIGNSLSELGYLLIESDPAPLKLASALVVDVLNFGATDVMESVKRAYLNLSTSLSIQQCLRALRRLLGLCMLASLVRCEEIVWTLCESTQHEVLPLLAARREGQGRVDGELRSPDDVPIMLLDMTVAVAGNLASLGSEDSTRPSLRVVGVAASLCFPLGTWASRDFPTFEWLAAYLRMCHGVVGLRAHDLASAADLANKVTENFKLPDYRGFFDE